MFDRTYLRAKAAMEGHKRGCIHCGWTGHWSDVKNRRATETWSTGKCPACGVEARLVAFRLWWGDGTAYEP